MRHQYRDVKSNGACQVLTFINVPSLHITMILSHFGRSEQRLRSKGVNGDIQFCKQNFLMGSKTQIYNRD